MLYFSKPHKDRETCLRARILAKLGKKLYSEGTHYIAGSEPKGHVDICVSQISRAILQRKCGVLPRIAVPSPSELGRIFTSLIGKEYSRSRIANYKRRPFIPRSVPPTATTLGLIQVLRGHEDLACLRTLDLDMLLAPTPRV